MFKIEVKFRVKVQDKLKIGFFSKKPILQDIE